MLPGVRVLVLRTPSQGGGGFRTALSQPSAHGTGDMGGAGLSCCVAGCSDCTREAPTGGAGEAGGTFSGPQSSRCTSDKDVSS